MKTCVYRARLLMLAFVPGVALPVLSQPASTPELEATVVTATRTDSRAGAVLADLTVITRGDIERSTGRTLSEVIARQAGVQTSSTGGLGKTSSLFIRGTENRHVLFLVDGVRYTSATAGTPPLDSIPLESIERIEVLKGPASALYGSDAVGGVVQIFTRRGAQGFTPYASATLGSASRSETTAGLRGGSGEVSYALGVQTLREKGFSATNPSAGVARFNRDVDGFSQESVNGSLDWRFATGWKADASLLQTDGVSHYDNGPGAFDNQIHVRSRIYSLGVEGRLTPAWKSRVALGQAEDLSTDFAAATPTAFDTQQDQLAWLNEIDTPLGKVLVGVERVEQRVRGTTVYTVDRRTTDSLFAGLNGEAGRHSWQANLRRDDDSQFGGADTGLLGYGFKLTPNLRAHASYGTSFKAPSFNTLYFPGFGNPTTQPERGRSAEIGAAYAWDDHEIKLVRFETRIQGFITRLPAVVNIPQARIEGWTLSYAGQAGRWSFRTALDLLDARNALTDRKLPRRADEQLTASADYAVDAWKLGATVLAVSERFDDVNNRVRLGGFATADLHADYALAKDWSMQLRLNNIADKNYQTAIGYNQPGRAAYVTLRWQPKSGR